MEHCVCVSTGRSQLFGFRNKFSEKESALINSRSCYYLKSNNLFADANSLSSEEL